jgi:hypothetical protein
MRTATIGLLNELISFELLDRNPFAKCGLYYLRTKKAGFYGARFSVADLIGSYGAGETVTTVNGA